MSLGITQIPVRVENCAFLGYWAIQCGGFYAGRGVRLSTSVQSNKIEA